MRIIINGPDNVGKTTLIRNLIKKIKLPFVSTNNYPPPYDNVYKNLSFEVYCAHQYFKLLKTFENVISDRCHLGMYVYGKMYRNYQEEYSLKCIEVEKEYINEEFFKDIYLITIYDKPENLIKRDDGKSFSIDLDKKIEEIQRFKDIHNFSHIKNKLLINIKDYNESELCEYIYNELK